MPTSHYCLISVLKSTYLSFGDGKEYRGDKEAKLFEDLWVWFGFALCALTIQPVRRTKVGMFFRNCTRV